MSETVDFLVVGGGIVGTAIAREIRRSWPDSSVCVIDKESGPAEHASGRNSGVLHAGFYYSPDSLKAQLTRDGNTLLRQFCHENAVPLRECGKVVVTTHQNQIASLDELFRRGQANGVDLEVISPTELRQLEPLARTVERALWSPRTAVADPRRVTEKMVELAEREGVSFRWGEAFVSGTKGRVQTARDSYSVGHVVNCAGLFADRVAGHFGMSDDYVMLPFTGLYAYAPKLKGRLQRHVYPVPDPRNPFLGVHATVTLDGSVKIGPTAIPALSREAYRAIRDLNRRDLLEIAKTYPKFLTSPHHKVLRLIGSEVPK